MGSLRRVRFKRSLPRGEVYGVPITGQGVWGPYRVRFKRSLPRGVVYEVPITGQGVWGPNTECRSVTLQGPHTEGG